MLPVPCHCMKESEAGQKTHNLHCNHTHCTSICAVSLHYSITTIHTVYDTLNCVRMHVSYRDHTFILKFYCKLSEQHIPSYTFAFKLHNHSFWSLCILICVGTPEIEALPNQQNLFQRELLVQQDDYFHLLYIQSFLASYIIMSQHLPFMPVTAHNIHDVTKL